MKSSSVERDELSVVKSHTTIKLGKYIFQVQEMYTRCKLVFTDILDAVDLIFLFVYQTVYDRSATNRFWADIKADISDSISFSQY